MPHIGAGIVVPRANPVRDGYGELFDTAVRPAVEPFVGELGEPAFY